MASKLGKATSSAAGGAGMGFMMGGPVGAGIGAGAGFLMGMMGGDDPDLVSSTYADIDLAKENPELYEQLMHSHALVDEAQKLYDQSRMSITPYEQDNYQRYVQDVNNRVSSSGLAGTSVGNQRINDAVRSESNNIADRVYKERMANFQNLAQTQGNYFNQYRGGLNDVMNARVGAYNNQAEQNSASNQMYSGIAMGGLQGFASAYNANQMANRPAPTYQIMNAPPGYNAAPIVSQPNYNPYTVGVPQAPAPIPYRNDYYGVVP